MVIFEVEDAPALHVVVFPYDAVQETLAVVDDCLLILLWDWLPEIVIFQKDLLRAFDKFFARLFRFVTLVFLGLYLRFYVSLQPWVDGVSFLRAHC